MQLWLVFLMLLNVGSMIKLELLKLLKKGNKELVTNSLRISKSLLPLKIYLTISSSAMIYQGDTTWHSVVAQDDNSNIIFKTQ